MAERLSDFDERLRTVEVAAEIPLRREAAEAAWWTVAQRLFGEWREALTWQHRFRTFEGANGFGIWLWRQMSLQYREPRPLDSFSTRTFTAMGSGGHRLFPQPPSTRPGQLLISLARSWREADPAIAEGYLHMLEAGAADIEIGQHVVSLFARPVRRVRNGVLHCDNGPAVFWRFGVEAFYYYLHGVNVHPKLVLTPAEEMDARWLSEWRQADVRREIIRKMGIERVLQQLGAKVIDQAGDYELLRLDLGDSQPRPYLKMKNPSLGVYHIEGVPPIIVTVKGALAWRNQTPVPPTVLT